MKPTLRVSKLIPSLLAVTLLAAMTLCADKNRVAGNSHELDEISDSLRVGNLAAAIRLTEESKEKALDNGDSAAWSELMVQQGINAYYSGNPELLIASTDSALRWLERQQPTNALAPVLAKAYQTHGAYYDQYNFNPDSTTFYLRKSVKQVEISGIRTELPQAYGNYANSLRMASALDSAAIYYHKAIAIADSLGLEDAHYVPLYNGIAAVFTDMHDFDNADIWWKKSMDIRKSMNQFDKFNTLTGYGNFLYYSERYHDAERIFSRLDRMLDSVPDSRWEKMFNDVNLADIYIHTGRNNEAKAKLDTTALYFTHEQPNPVALSYIHTLQMRVAIADNDLTRAAEISLRHPDSDSLRLEQRLARLKTLENVYSKTGNYQKAFSSRIIYDQLNDSLRSHALKHQISTLNAIYQRDHRILNLEAENSQKQAHIYMLLAVIACTIAIIAALTLYFINRRISSRLREERIMNKLISLRQENLRNRVTPHFIYNALNHELLNTSQGEPSHLDALVSLIRKQQLVASEMLIPFSEELKFVDDYIKVIGYSSGAPLNYTYTIDPDIEPSFLFPSMTLQILVENVFKHGFTSIGTDVERLLAISVTHTEKNKIAVSVFNNGESQPISDYTGTGIRVLMETIKLINDRDKTDITLDINPDSEQNGVKGYYAVITLPANLKNENRQ